MYEDLIKRLRNVSMEFGQLDHVSVLLLEAANVIEELSKRSECPYWYGDIRFCSMLGKPIPESQKEET